MLKRLSREQREQDVLDALGNSEMSVQEIYDLLSDLPGWEPQRGSGEAQKNLVRQTADRLFFAKRLVKIPTGKGRPKWLYALAERPVTGELAELEKQFA